MNVTELRKVSDTKYIASVASRLKVRKGAADNDNIKWTSYQNWIKVKDKWLLESVKDTTPKIGNRDRRFHTNPVKNYISRSSRKK